MQDHEARPGAIDWDAPVPEPYATALRRVLRRMFDPELWRPGTDLGDVSTIVGVGGRSEREQLEAAERIAHRIGRPVHRERSQRVLEAVGSFAGELGHRGTPWDELHWQAALRIFEITRDELGTWTPDEILESPQRAYTRLWTRLNRELSSDLLGPEWRHDVSKYPPPERPNDIAQLEARLDLELLLARAELSTMEAAAIHAELNGAPPKELAREHRIAVNTAYAHKHRAMEKLRRAAM